MADINSRLLKINGTDISNICEYTVEYNKLWKGCPFKDDLK